MKFFEVDYFVNPVVDWPDTDSGACGRSISQRAARQDLVLP